MLNMAKVSKNGLDMWQSISVPNLHLADAFIQSDLHCIQAINFFVCTCVPWELNPRPFALLTQCSTTEPQEHSFQIHSFWARISFWKFFLSMALHDVMKGGIPCLGISPGRENTSTRARARVAHQHHRQRCTGLNREECLHRSVFLVVRER